MTVTSVQAATWIVDDFNDAQSASTTQTHNINGVNIQRQLDARGSVTVGNIGGANIGDLVIDSGGASSNNVMTTVTYTAPTTLVTGLADASSYYNLDIEFGDTITANTDLTVTLIVNGSEITNAISGRHEAVAGETVSYTLSQAGYTAIRNAITNNNNYAFRFTVAHQNTATTTEIQNDIRSLSITSDDTATVKEPGSLSLFLLPGMFGLYAAGRRRKQNQLDR